MKGCPPTIAQILSLQVKTKVQAEAAILRDDARRICEELVIRLTDSTDIGTVLASWDRAVRELLINVAQHAQTDSAIVESECRDGRIMVRVSDSGSAMTHRPSSRDHAVDWA